MLFYICIYNSQNIFQNEKTIIVDGFEGLLVDYAKRKDVYTIIRGLRAVSDFDFEFQMALTNRTLDTKIDTMFLMTDAKYSYLSSSIVKQLAKYGGNISELVPQEVESALKEKQAREERQRVIYRDTIVYIKEVKKL